MASPLLICPYLTTMANVNLQCKEWKSRRKRSWKTRKTTHCEPPMQRMKIHKEEIMENQSDHPQQAATGTTFLRTCFNVLNALSVDSVGFHQRGRLLNWAGLPTAISLYALCYCSHPVFPTLCTSMKDRSQFSKVLVIYFILYTLNYGAMVVLGYLVYGEDLKSQVTLNLPLGKLSSKIAMYTTLVNPFTKYTIMIISIAAAIEDWFPSRNSRESNNSFRIRKTASADSIWRVWNAFLYVGDLDPSIDEAQLYDLFIKVALVVSVRICRVQIKRVSLGYAYVNYNITQNASNAMELLNCTPINGRSIISHRDPSI
ncbi:hypothetical protein NE237_027701 [Protea cynaroides]|uniref:RRM domain-containing protein n=1 Tax=Protea cynaroides TaxID=273540 RepID=A0A9Q0JS59_9MAGN|nr:hypothetical protein NE237_027701 [Protea cynaroides]